MSDVLVATSCTSNQLRSDISCFFCSICLFIYLSINQSTDHLLNQSHQPIIQFEPGSGSTIMSYSGLCAQDNIADHSDAYFHIASLEQIHLFVRDPERGGSCGQTSSISVSNVPRFTMPIDSSQCIIPKETPFQLEVDLSVFDIEGLPTATPTVEPTDAPTKQASNTLSFHLFSV
jgi:hypothetical protein